MPIHNRIEKTKRFLECLKFQKAIEFNLIVVNDGSTDESEILIRSEYPNAHIIEGSGKLWWAGSLSAGVNLVKGFIPAPNDIICFINNDVEFNEYFFKTACDYIESSPNEYLLVIARLKLDANETTISGSIVADFSKLSFTPAQESETANCSSTRGLFMSWNSLVRTGGFRPKLLPHYLSDYEFTLRASKRGANIFSPMDVMVQLDEKTSGIRKIEANSRRDFLKQYFSYRHTGNPLHWLVFLILIPNKWTMKNILRILFQNMRNFGLNFLFGRFKVN